MLECLKLINVYTKIQLEYIRSKYMVLAFYVSFICSYNTIVFEVCFISKGLLGV